MANENKTPKITKAMRYADIRVMVTGEGEIPLMDGAPRTTAEQAAAFIDHEVELLSRKNTSSSGEKKLTDAQKKNIEYKAMIYDFMASQPDEYAATCTAIGNSIPTLVAALGNQATTSKFSSLCHSLVADGKLINESVKGQSLFRMA